MRKGQQDILSAIMLTGIMIVVVGAVYFWGIPLVNKNRDVNALQNSEDFMRTLSDKIKFVANNAGRDQLTINVPAQLSYISETDKIQLSIDTEGSIYSIGGAIPLSRFTGDCNNVADGTWGTDQPEVLCVQTTKIADNKYRSVYMLDYRYLLKDGKKYKIDLTGATASAGQDHTIVIEYDGSRTESGIINTDIKITLI